MILLGLCGYATVGKDAICAELGFTRAAFADELKADLVPLIAKLPTHTKQQIRPLFVEYGRTARRIDPDYWVKRLVLPNAEEVCLTDCRYCNELDFVLSRGGMVVRIYRPGVGPANDEEKQSIADVDLKYPYLPFIVNNESLAAAAWTVRGMLEKHNVVNA